MAYHARRGTIHQIIEDLVEIAVCDVKFVHIFDVSEENGQTVFGYGIIVNC